jgi:hypothetical protein
VIRGCARGSNWSQTRRSGPGKHAAFDGVARGSGPGTSSLGGESNPVNPSAGSATGSVRGRFTTLAPGRQRREEGALLGGPPESRARRTDQAELLGQPGTIVQSMLKLEARRQAKLHSIMLSAKVSAGWTAWKPSSPAKAAGGGDSRTERSVGCSCCKSVANAR